MRPWDANSCHSCGEYPGHEPDCILRHAGGGYDGEYSAYDSERSAWWGEASVLQDRVAELEGECNRALAAGLAACERLRAMLARAQEHFCDYGKHQDSCDKVVRGSYPCSCGYREAVWSMLEDEGER